MKTKLDKENVVFEIYYWNGSWEFLRFVKFKEIINSQIDVYDVDVNTLDFTFQFQDDFNELVNNFNQYQIRIDRKIFENESAGYSENDTYNPKFFMTFHKFTYDAESEEITLQIQGQDWKTFENRKIVEHTVEYTEASLPVDPDTGEKIYPYDFNKIKYPITPYFGGTARYFNDIMQDVYGKNMGFVNSDLQNLPYNRVKGLPHNYDPLRYNQFLRGLIVNGDIIITYDILYEKKSILEFKNDYWNFARSRNDYNTFAVEVKEEVVNGVTLLVVVYNKSKEITINNIDSKDVALSYTSEADFSNHINNVLVESSNDDFFSAEKYQPIQTYSDFKIETIDSASADSDNSTEMQTKAETVLGVGLPLITQSFEIEFKDYEYFVDFTAGDFIVLENFAFFDGKYKINQISETIEEDLISYAVEKMEKVE